MDMTIEGPPNMKKICFFHDVVHIPVYEKQVVNFYLPRRRRPGTGDIVTPPVRLSVCLSVRLSVCPSRLVFAL